MHRQAYPGAIERLLHAQDDAGVSRTQLKILFILSRPHSKPPRVSRIAEMVRIDPAQAARVIDDLDRKRCVDCVRDEDDARVKRVHLTPTGQGVLDRLQDEQYDPLEYDDYLDHIGADGRKALRALLTHRATRP